VSPKRMAESVKPGVEGQSAKAKQKLLELGKDTGEITTAYLVVNYAQPNDIASKITEIKGESGKVSVDERNSLIIYTDYPARIENARQLMARLDRATPQVMIEARIVTINADLTRSLGVAWKGVFKSAPDMAKDFDFNVSNISAGGSLFDFSLGKVIGGNMLKLDLSLEALETTRDSKIIAAPKVLTLNNVRASISQGTEIPYTTPAGTVVDEEGKTAVVYNVQFKSALLELIVTPHITPDRRIRLEIEASHDEPDPALTGAGGQPAISTRKIKTELLVDDGSIVVIGGAMRDTQGKNLESTPGLSQIPILGRLFKLEGTRREKQELLIFINPKIVEATLPPQLR